MPDPGRISQDPDAPSRWFSFVEESSAIDVPHGNLPKPAKNAWLFPVEGSDTFATQIKAIAQCHKLSHSSYLISGEITLMSK